MPDELLFTVDGSEATRVDTITLAQAGLTERQDLQEWVLAHPDILGSGVMIVSFEFDRWWTHTGAAPLDRLDVLGLDETGHLVVAELKRDKAPDTIEMQAIKYAAMASRFNLETLASQHARFLTGRGQACTADEALEKLMGHAEDLSGDTLARPRIVLVASEFPPVVTATTVWLTEMGLDLTLMRYQAYRTGTQTLLSVSQMYPVADVEEFTVAPRSAETRTVVATKKRTQDTSAVRRLVSAGSIEDDTGLTLRPRTEVNADVRAAIAAWVGEDPARGRVTWKNDASAPLVWEVDGQAYTPSGLVRHIIAETSGIDRSVQGTRWWFDADGHDLVELSATGKTQQYLSFWTRFLERVHAEHPDWTKAQIPQPQSWFNMPSPISGTTFGVSFAQGSKLRAELYIDCGDATQNSDAFTALESRRASIEDQFGQELSWEPLPDRQACRIADYTDGNVSDVEDHEIHITWFFDRIARLRTALTGIAE